MSRYLSKTIRLRRFEAILTGIERGLPQDFQTLLDEWPSDIPSSKRALEEVLKHLSAERVPTLSIANAGEAAYRLVLCREALNVLTEVLDRMDKMREEHVQELYAVIQGRLPDLLAWFSFLGEHSATIAPEAANRFGPLVAANTLRRLLDKDRVQYLQGDMASLEGVVDIVLAMWMDSVPDDTLDGSGEDDGDGSGDLWLSADDYDKYVYPIFRTFWSCIKVELTRGIAVQRIAAFDRAQLVHLAHAFTYRCEQWATTYQDDPGAIDNCSDFVATVILCQMLTEAVPAFSRIVARSAFPSVVMEAAMAFPLESGRRGREAIPVQIARLLLYPQPSSAYETLHIVPELLGCGLLRLIAHQLISPRPPDTDPFREWCGREPLLWLYHMSYHPRISNALRWAIDMLPDETSDALWENPNSSQLWQDFYRAVNLYEKAYEPVTVTDDEDEDEDFIEPITLCDNIDHFQTSGTPMWIVESVQCSWCHVRAYCSEECQRYDWKARHRHECADDRIYRIDLQLNGAWISHRSRMLLFRVSEFLLESCIPVMNKMEESKSPEQGKEKVIVFADHTSFPLALHLLELKTFLTMSHGRNRLMFGDDRSLALIEEFKKSEGLERLVASIAPFGEYFIVTLGRFLEEPISESEEDEDGDESGGEEDSEGSESWTSGSDSSDEPNETTTRPGQKNAEGQPENPIKGRARGLGDDEQKPSPSRDGSNNAESSLPHDQATGEGFDPEPPLHDLVLINGFIRVMKVVHDDSLYEIEVPKTGIVTLSSDHRATVTRPSRE